MTIPAMTTTGEVLKPCPRCGEPSGSHWIGCSVHIQNVMKIMPEYLRIEAEAKSHAAPSNKEVER